MRIFLVAWLIVHVEAVAKVFSEQSNVQYQVEPSSYSVRRILRNSGLESKSRVFRNVQIVAAGEEPRLLRASGRFHKRAQAVPIHDTSSIVSKDSVQVTAYNYDEEKHHEKKLVEDSGTMTEAHEYARGLERTTVAIKTDATTTTAPIPSPSSVTLYPPPISVPPAVSEEQRHEFRQPPPVFAQTQPQIKHVPGARTFAQTVQAGSVINPGLPVQTPPPQRNSNQPSHTAFSVTPRPPFIPQFPPHGQPSANTGTSGQGSIPHGQQPPLIPAIPGQPATTIPLGFPNLPGQIPNPSFINPGGVNAPHVPQVPQLPPQILPQNHIPPTTPNVPTMGTAGTAAVIQPPPQQVQVPGQIAQPLQPPQQLVPPRDNRFEVINGQAANSSLGQLGCGFDWITNSCKDVFGLGWCGRCHDFGNIFVHDCKCIQPLIQLPPRPPQQPRPTSFLLL